MEFSFSTLFAGFIFGVIGMYLIKRGRDQSDLWWIGIGIAMIVYPYFFSNGYFVWGIGGVLVWAAYLFR